MKAGNCNAVISGIGKSAIGRPLERGALDLTLDATLQAIADAGLEPSDIDGVASWPGYAPEPAGFSPVSITDLKEALRLPLRWYCGGMEQSGQFAAIGTAAAAVSCGLARHVLCYRTHTEASAQARQREAMMAEFQAAASSGKPAPAPSRAARIPEKRYQWQLPFDAYTAANWIAMYAQRHFHDYGTTREQMGAVVLNARRNAQRNPDALFQKPLSMEDYLGSRMVSTPFCLFDCDQAADASTAVIVSAAETAADLRVQPIAIESVGLALTGRDSWDQFEDLALVHPMHSAARSMWDNTDLTQADVDVAQLYDGFSFLTLAWLEALGFCGDGESGAFVEGGDRIALEGELPVNTDGGQLSAGKRHGYGFIHEACVQLRGEGGERQVPDAQVAVAAVGGGPQSTCLLLSRR